MRLLLQGILIGFSIAAPVGPIGLLCINRSLQKGYLSGFISGLGAATADGVYGFITAFGLTTLTNFLLGYQQWIQFIGGCLLFYLGIRTWQTKPSTKMATIENNVHLIKNFITTFFLTLTNPLTILSFTAILAGLGLANGQTSYSKTATLVAGIMLGSVMWWFILSNTASMFKDKFPLHRINYLSGLVLMLFGLFSILKLIKF